MKDRMKLAGAALFALTLAAGCGGGGGDSANKAKEESKPATEMTQSATPPATSGQAASLSGKINLEGAAPARVAIKMAADPVCAKAHTEPAMSQDVLVDESGMLKNVLVYVKNGLEGQTFDTPTEPVVFDQHGCQYEPHVFGIMVGQPFKILNSDPTLHNIHALPKEGEFNLGMPKQGMEFTKSFPKPEVPVHIKCDVHPWMSAYCGVLTHPFYAVSDEHGNYTIKDLPAGTYTIAAWHEKYGEQTQQVTVGAEPPPALNFTFKVSGS